MIISHNNFNGIGSTTPNLQLIKNTKLDGGGAVALNNNNNNNNNNKNNNGSKSTVTSTRSRTMGDVALISAKQKRQKVLSFHNNNGKNNHNNKRTVCSSLHNNNGISEKTKNNNDKNNNSNINNNEFNNLNGLLDDNIGVNISSDISSSSVISGVVNMDGMDDNSTKPSILPLTKIEKTGGSAASSLAFHSKTADMANKDISVDNKGKDKNRHSSEESDSDSIILKPVVISGLSSGSPTPEALKSILEPQTTIVSNEH